MGMKIDRFTLGIILGVLLLVVGAVITIAFTGGRGWQSADYLKRIRRKRWYTTRSWPLCAMSRTLP